MFNRLDAIEKRYNELSEELVKPEVLNDFNKLKELSKEQRDLEETVKTYEEYKKVDDNLHQAEAMAEDLFNIGTIKDKTTTMSTEDGDTLQAVATGGVVVAEEEGEPQVSITTRIMEMDFDTENKLTGAVKAGTAGSETLTVKTNVIPDDFSLKLTPKNIGSTGIKARRTHISFRPGSSEEEGHYVDVTFKILACEDGELYTKFKVAAADWTALS